MITHVEPTQENCILRLPEHCIGLGMPAFLVAEVGQAHDGSLGLAHAYIDAAADSGVNAVKFQAHIAYTESTLDEPFRVAFSKQDETRYAYWERMEFSHEQWAGLVEHTRQRELDFIVSPFSTEAVEMLLDLNVSAWKVGSGEAVSGELFDALIQTRKPVFCSTGMSSMREIDEIVQRFKNKDIPFAVLQCTSKYPTSFKDVGLNIIDDLQARYDCVVGLSDHTGSVFPSLAAIGRGANIIEAHIVFDKRMFGPDTHASLTPDDFTLLARFRDAFNEMMQHPVDKDTMAESMMAMRGIFGKSLAPVRRLVAGEVLTEDMLTAKKPGGGIPVEEKEQLVGRRLARDVAPDRLLSPQDLEDYDA